MCFFSYVCCPQLPCLKDIVHFGQPRSPVASDIISCMVSDHWILNHVSGPRHSSGGPQLRAIRILHRLYVINQDNRNETINEDTRIFSSMKTCHSENTGKIQHIAWARQHLWKNTESVLVAFATECVTLHRCGLHALSSNAGHTYFIRLYQKNIVCSCRIAPLTHSLQLFDLNRAQLILLEQHPVIFIKHLNLCHPACQQLDIISISWCAQTISWGMQHAEFASNQRKQLCVSHPI